MNLNSVKTSFLLGKEAIKKKGFCGLIDKRTAHKEHKIVKLGIKKLFEELLALILIYAIYTDNQL